MATHDESGELFACFGNMGGFMQPQGHLQVSVSKFPMHDKLTDRQTGGQTDRQID